MSIKTVVVFVQFKGSQHHDWKAVTEFDVFGEGLPYETAKDFIKAVKDLHRKHSYEFTITNVVIG